MLDLKKTRLSLAIGFLFLVLLSMLFYLFQIALRGSMIGQWVLFLLFGTIAVVLVSFGIGYIILLLTTSPNTTFHRGTEFRSQRTTNHQPTTWVDIRQLPGYGPQPSTSKRRKTPRRPAKKRR